MPRKRHTAEQIIGKLREAEVSLSGGHTETYSLPYLAFAYDPQRTLAL